VKKNVGAKGWWGVKGKSSKGGGNLRSKTKDFPNSDGKDGEGGGGRIGVRAGEPSLTNNLTCGSCPLGIQMKKGGAERFSWLGLNGKVSRWC